MAIPNPVSGTAYCLVGESGAVVEWQNPTRDITDPTEYPWQRVALTSDQIPFIPVFSATTGTLVETVTLSPGGDFTTVNTLVKDRFYTFAASGTISLPGGRSYDACYYIDGINEPTPNPRITTNDPQFEQLFFVAAVEGDVTFQAGSSAYSVGYIGNDATVTISLPSGGSGVITIDIFENDYSLELFDELLTISYFSSARNKPFANLNLACGGSCPSSTSFSCDCSGVVSCYFDDQEGSIDKTFEGTATP